MSEFVGLWMFPALFALIAIGFPIAFSMFSVAFLFGLLRFGDNVISLLISKVNEIASTSILAAIPLFIFMGALLEKSGIAERLFDAIYMWTRRLPGGLAIGAVLMCTIFAAATGVAGATETVVGLLAIPAMLRYAYDKRLIAGSICSGGSLGTVIPPSITVIVLAPVATLPVGSLFAGILLPGLIMSGLFLGYIVTSCWIWPDRAPRPSDEDETTLSLLEKLWFTAKALVPPILLIIAVLGSILSGWATPTEAAACGASGSLLLAALHGRFLGSVLRDAAMRTLSVTAMIILIVLGGSIFSSVFYASGGMRAVEGILDTLGIVGWQAIAMILVVTFIMGFVLDLLSVILIVIPVAISLVRLYGFDPLWFSIVFLVVLQTAYLTPPMAPSIFYLRGIAPKSITLGHMYSGVLPFIAMQLVTVALVVTFPELATRLPEIIYGR